MKQPPGLKIIVRTVFAVMSREAATRMIRSETERTLAVFRNEPEARKARREKVPTMPGVDEDMRDWSFYRILEHNRIVNQEIARVIRCLVWAEDPSSDFNVKSDVIPPRECGPEAEAAFQESVDAHLRELPPASPAWKNQRFRHPIFGMLTAHGWHCMFGLHLRIHRRQTEALHKVLMDSK